MHNPPGAYEIFEGVCGSTHEVYACARRFAPLPYPLLITGEQGTGKTALARYIHEMSGRKGAFREASLAQSIDSMEGAEFRGHVKGGFTSAIHYHRGYFEQAHEGTLFLDELGLASLKLQGVLLRQMATNLVTPVGAERDVAFDVRVIAATNRDLDDMVSRGVFLQDLFSRFGFYQIHLPPLRDRQADILEYFGRFLCRECEALERAVPRLSIAAERTLLRAPWPGNVRDLVSMAQWLAGTAPNTVEIRHLPPQFLAGVGETDTEIVEPRARAIRALEACGGNKAEAARLANMSRSHLYRLIKGAAIR